MVITWTMLLVMSKTFCVYVTRMFYSCSDIKKNFIKHVAYHPKATVMHSMGHRDHFVYAASQWETTLHCNAVSHWLVTYTKWSLWAIMMKLIGRNKIICTTLFSGWYSLQYPSAYMVIILMAWAFQVGTVVVYSGEGICGSQTFSRHCSCWINEEWFETL